MESGREKEEMLFVLLKKETVNTHELSLKDRRQNA